MRSNSSGFARTVFFLESDQELLPGGILSQAEDSRFRKGPREMGIADFGAGASRAFAVRCLGALDQTTGGGQLLDPREAVEVVDVVEPYETANLADAWDGLSQI